MAIRPSVPIVVAPTANRRLPSSGRVARLSRIFISWIPAGRASVAPLRPTNQRIEIVVSESVQARPDALCYTTDPLDRAVEVTGPITITLFAASSATDTDFTAMLCDIHPNGYSQNVVEGMIRARYRES